MKLLSIAYIIVNIILFCSLCEKIYIFFSMGKTIIRSKKKEYSKFNIMWGTFVILIIIHLLTHSVRGYSLLFFIAAIQFFILQIIYGLGIIEIKEKGILIMDKYLYCYKWKEIRNYRLIDSNKLVFERVNSYDSSIDKIQIELDKKPIEELISFLEDLIPQNNFS